MPVLVPLQCLLVVEPLVTHITLVLLVALIPVLTQGMSSEVGLVVKKFTADRA